MITKEELECYLYEAEDASLENLYSKARDAALKVYGKSIYIRGLIEFTNYCKNDCLYCGIRRSNLDLDRYRLDRADIIACVNEGYELGYRTFVLQGGEDSNYSDKDICDIVYVIKTLHDDVAVTLSIGEKEKSSYKAYYDAGADRYLLRHETADEEHYAKLHPNEMSFTNRMRCLYDLKEIGFQVGCGFMVGSPYQSVDTLYKDICFIDEFKPHMVGIGPFISHKDTPFKNETNGTLKHTRIMISLLRLMNPKLLIPATTSLATIVGNGRELGILSGANVIMPNLSPVRYRELYQLYDGKVCMGEEAAQCINCIKDKISDIGYEVVIDRGDYKA